MRDEVDSPNLSNSLVKEFDNELCLGDNYFGISVAHDFGRFLRQV